MKVIFILHLQNNFTNRCVRINKPKLRMSWFAYSGLLLSALCQLEIIQLIQLLDLNLSNFGELNQSEVKEFT